MTAPQIIERELTFQFAPTVQSNPTSKPSVLDIAIIPTTDASSNSAGATFVSGVQSVQVELVNPVNTVTFSLIPSYAPGLTNPITYRVLWRIGTNSRTFTYDFVMPDQDLTWEQLTGTAGNIISGDAYLQPSDLGVPNGVARLDRSGNVLNSQGVICVTQADLSNAETLITQETVNREAAQASLQANLQSQVVTQAQSVLQSAELYVDHKIVGVESTLQAEITNRVNGDAIVQDNLNSVQTTLLNDLNLVQTQVTANSRALGAKASLVDGQVPVNELPMELLVSKAFSVPTQTAMLALPRALVSPGDFAVQPTGTYLLIGQDPSLIDSWTLLSRVQSVNGLTGKVTLTAGDLNALPANQQIPESQVIGLENDLKSKATQVSLDAWAAQLQAVQSSIGASGSGSIVTLNSSGQISSSLLDDGVAYINDLNQITNKAGSVISTGGTGGIANVVTSIVVGDEAPQDGQVTITAALLGALTPSSSILWSQVGTTDSPVPKFLVPSGAGGLVTPAQIDVTSLAAKLTTKADLVVPPGGGPAVVPIAEIPTIPTDHIIVDVSGNSLSTLLASNGLSATSNVGDEASTALGLAQAGGGGGGGGSSTNSVYFVSTQNGENTRGTGSNPWPDINLYSPWGIDTDGSTTGTVGAWYYLGTGAKTGDQAFPTMSPNGHLNLTKWNEAAPADPVLASQDFVTAITGPLSSTVSAIKDQQTIDTGDISTLTAQQNIDTANIHTLQTQAAALNSVVLNGGTVTPQTGTPYTLATSSDIETINANLLANYATTASVTGVIGQDLANYVPIGAWTAANWTTFQSNWPTVAGWINTPPWMSQGFITDEDVPQISIDTAHHSFSLTQGGDVTTVTASTLNALTPSSSIAWSQIGTAGSPVPALAILTSAGILPMSVVPLSGQVNLKNASNLEGLVTDFLGVSSGSSTAGSGNEVSTGNICVVYDASDSMQTGVFILTGTNAGVLDNRNSPSLLSYAAALSPSIGSGTGGWLEVTGGVNNAITSITAPSGDSVAVVNGQATLTTADLGTVVTGITANGTALANNGGIVNITPAGIGALSSANFASTIGPYITAYNYLPTSTWESAAAMARADYVATVPIATTSGGYTPQPKGIYSLNNTQSSLIPPPGSVVLLTAQANSSFNGLWTVGAVGAQWTQVYPQSMFKPGMLVVVTNQSNGPADATVNCNSMWVQTASAGAVGGSSQSWTLACNFSPPISITGSGGVTVTGTALSTAVGTGISNANNKLSIVPNSGTYGVAQSWTSPIPLSNGSGWSVSGTAFTYTPSGPALTNPYPTVQVWSTSAGVNTLVLAGASVTQTATAGQYKVTVYFETAPSQSGQYVLSIVG